VNRCFDVGQKRSTKETCSKEKRTIIANFLLNSQSKAVVNRCSGVGQKSSTKETCSNEKRNITAHLFLNS